MLIKNVFRLAVLSCLLSVTFVFAEPTLLTGGISGGESSWAEVVPAIANGQKGIAVMFTGADNLHYYADPETAVVAQFVLSVTPEADGLEFKQAIYPEAKTYIDKTQNGKEVKVFAGNFNVFVPFSDSDKSFNGEIKVKIKGQTCTESLCLPPFTKFISTEIDFAGSNAWKPIEMPGGNSLEEPDGVVESKASSLSGTWYFYFASAILAGLLFNVMPCVLPVMPLIISRLVNQSADKKNSRFAIGLSFCFGIMAFFAVIAVASLIMKFAFGTVLNWGDQFRVPGFIIGMGAFLVVLALFMFDVFQIAIPSSVASKGGGDGLMGNVSTGFLAALLSTPCSGAILAGVIAWAQTQNALVSTLAILLIGFGMALPYAILLSVPKLMNSLPKPGTWMENVRKAMGFILLFIAINLMTALTRDMLRSALYFTIVLSFSVWIWGGWVNYRTPKNKKYVIRLFAVLLSIAAGFFFLPQKTEIVDWHKYSQEAIAKAQENNQPVLIKFTADWCTSCKYLDKTVYRKKVIADLIEQKGVMPVKGDTTFEDSPATYDHANLYNESGVPVTVIIMGDGTQKKLVGTFTKEQLVEILDELPDVIKE